MTLTQALPPPLIIAGTGGSGTRAVRQALSCCGLFLGDHLNRSGDAMAFEPWLDEFIDPVLGVTRSLDYRPEALPEALRQAAQERLRGLVEGYRRELTPPEAPWGCKNPRAMYLLPLWGELFPGLKFLHVVRDGRDMAISENQRQVQRHFATLFGHPPPEHMPTASLQLWEKVNLEARRWGERHLGGHYRLLRFEDLCRHPRELIPDLCAFAGLPSPPAERLEAAAAVLLPLATEGRWRSADDYSKEVFRRIGRDALTLFGYGEKTPPEMGPSADPEATIRQQQARIRELEERLTQLQGSTSWRVTAPLRKLKGILKD
jgi:hypothetical protein